MPRNNTIHREYTRGILIRATEVNTPVGVGDTTKMDRPIIGIKSVAGGDGVCSVSKEVRPFVGVNSIAGGDGLSLVRSEAARCQWLRSRSFVQSVFAAGLSWGEFEK